MAARQSKTSRRGRITSDLIIEAALELSDSSIGLDAVTVRSLASKLDVGTMTLYGYFRSKDEILDAMADHVMGGFTMPTAEDEKPEDAIRAVADGFLSLMSEHPSVVHLLATRVTRSQASLQGAMEAVIQRLVDAGISGPVAVECYGFLIQHAMGFAAYQAPRRWGQDSDPEVVELRRQQQHFYAALPAGDFPRVVELAEPLVALPARTMYDFAVDALVQRIAR